MRSERVFIAYPANPPQLGHIIDAAARTLREERNWPSVETWKQIDVAGHFIADEILAKIDAAHIVVADITKLNFNVCYEIGYAIGIGKCLFLTLNSGLQPQQKETVRLGVYDSIGHKAYSNSSELVSHLESIHSLQPLKFPDAPVDPRTPLFVVDVAQKTDASIRTIARIKKTKIAFRSFDPFEQSRLTTPEAYRNVASAVAVVVQLLSTQATDYETNNYRAAFVAGLANGLDKELLMLQEAGDPVPMDYRDLVAEYKHPSDIDDIINDLAPRVMDGLQNIASSSAPTPSNFLMDLDLGESAAENEMAKLAGYYLHTDHYARTLNGSARLVVGRKGSGKTAMFFQVRNNIRRNRQRIVLDLKPEGYQLKQFKDLLLAHFGEGVQERICKSFWEYVLLLELAKKLLDADRSVHVGNKKLYEAYQELARLYSSEEHITEGDFSERMLRLVERLTRSNGDHREGAPKRHLFTAAEVAQLLYTHDFPALRASIVNYMKQKKDAWILFDNIDKGWPTRGVQAPDIIILRGLLDATRDIERIMAREDVEVHTVVFLRNDVYELLIDETPDRGKESRVSLDWTDRDLLKALLRRRFLTNKDVPPNSTFEDTWHRIAISHVDGESSADRLIELSLMRPRNLINLVSYCKSNAINMSRAKITGEDIHKAASQYSADLASDIGHEIQDVFPKGADVLYAFIGAPAILPLKDIYSRLTEANIPADEHSKLLEILLWFAFVGVVGPGGDPTQYAYSVFYDMKKLRRLAKDCRDDMVRFEIHPAFRPFLEIS